MADFTCNLADAERTHRKIIGGILIVAALLDMGRGFLFLAGAVLVAQGFIGWCGIPILLEKFKKK